MKTIMTTMLSAALVVFALQPTARADDKNGFSASLFLGGSFLIDEGEQDRADNYYIDDPAMGTTLGLQYRFLDYLAVNAELYHGGNVSSGAGSRNWGILTGIKAYYPIGNFDPFVQVGVGLGSYVEHWEGRWGSGSWGESAEYALTLGFSGGIDYRLLDFLSVGVWCKYYKQFLPDEHDQDVTKVVDFDDQLMVGGGLTFHF